MYWTEILMGKVRQQCPVRRIGIWIVKRSRNCMLTAKRMRTLNEMGNQLLNDMGNKY